MYAELTFREVWTVEYIVRQRIVNRLCEAAQLAATNLTANRARLKSMLEDLEYELDASDLCSTAAASAAADELDSGLEVA